MTKAELRQTWKTRIADYQKSGQNAKQWCALNGVTPRQLYYWRKKLLAAETPSSFSCSAPVRWLPVKIKEQEIDFKVPEKTRRRKRTG